MSPFHPHRFGALVGAWCLGASLGGWIGAAVMTGFAAFLLSFLEKREKIDD